VAYTISNLGADSHRLGRIDEALEHFRTALAIFDQAFGRDSVAATKTLASMANALTSQGRYAEAGETYRHAIAIADEKLGPLHTEAGALHNNYADLLERQKDHTRALEHFRRAAAIFETTVGTSSADHALALLNICTVEVERNRPREAMTACARGLPVLERELGPTHSLVAQVLVGAVSLAYAANGRCVGWRDLLGDVGLEIIGRVAQPASEAAASTTTTQ
jgi:tetratricopeptide (TPR) repeat protein